MPVDIALDKQGRLSVPELIIHIFAPPWWNAGMAVLRRRPRRVENAFYGVPARTATVQALNKAK